MRVAVSSLLLAPLVTMLAGCSTASGGAEDPTADGSVAGDVANDATSDDATSDDGSGADTTSIGSDDAPAIDSSADATADTQPIVDTAPVIDRSRCTAQPDVVGQTSRTANGGGGAITYLAYAFAGYDSRTPAPLFVALHGAGDTSANYFQVLLRSIAESKHLVVIVPEGSYPVGSGFSWTGADAPRVLDAIDDVGHCYSIDPKRRILHGFSAGGVMTYFIGLASAQTFSGLAIASADLSTAEAIAGHALLPAPWKIPVSQFHGTNDTNFPIQYARAGRDRLLAAGHVVTWHEFAGGHTTNANDVATMIDDLAASRAP